MNRIFLIVGAAVLLSCLSSAQARVVINEIMYHPIGEPERGEYIELYNAGSTAINLRNYAFTDGIYYTFTESTILGPDEYIVLAKDAEYIRLTYGISNVVGDFLGRLSNSGERLLLEDNLGRVVDDVTYSDRAPWPLRAGGDGPSLERVDPLGESNNPFNWRASATPFPGMPWGSPGKPNSRIVVETPPEIINPRHRPQLPIEGEPLFIRATVLDDSGVSRVWVEYLAQDISGKDRDLPIPYDQWLTLDLVDDGTLGDREAGDASYESAMPPLPGGTLVRYRIHAVDPQGRGSVAPGPSVAAGHYALYIRGGERFSPYPIYQIVLTPANLNRLRVNALSEPPDPLYDQTQNGVFIDHEGQAYPQVAMRLDGTRDERRAIKPSWRVHFNAGNLFGLASAIQLDAQFHPQNPSRRGDAGLYESIAWRIFRRAGVPSRRTETALLRVNGEEQGVYLQRETMDAVFLQRVGKNRTANLYLSDGHPTEYPFARGDESLFTDLTLYQRVYRNLVNPNAPNSDLVTLIGQLNTREGDALKNVFDARLDARGFVSYLAAGAATVDEDRVWRKRALYHDPVTGRWEIFPVQLNRVFENNHASPFLHMGRDPETETWPLASRFMRFEEHETAYRARLTELLRDVFVPTRLREDILDYVETYRAAADLDRSLWGDEAGYPSIDDHARELMRFIVERRAFLLQSLGAPVIFSNALAWPGAPRSNDEVEIGLDVQSPLAIDAVIVRYRVDGGAPIEIAMRPETNNASLSVATAYRTTLPPQPQHARVSYHFLARLGDGGEHRHPAIGDRDYSLHYDDRVNRNDQHIVINEIMYNSDIRGNEWVELYNRGDAAVDISGWTILDDNDEHRFTLPEQTVLPPDGYLVVAQDETLAYQIYGILNVIGGVDYGWGSSGDQVRIVNAMGQMIALVDYTNLPPWPTEPDGGGPSLELLDPFGAQNDPANWRASTSEASRGTPGRRNSVAPPVGVRGWMLY